MQFPAVCVNAELHLCSISEMKRHLAALHHVSNGAWTCVRRKWIHYFPHSLRDVISSVITVESLVVVCSDRQDLMTCHL